MEILQNHSWSDDASQGSWEGNDGLDSQKGLEVREYVEENAYPGARLPVHGSWRLEGEVVGRAARGGTVLVTRPENVSSFPQPVRSLEGTPCIPGVTDAPEGRHRYHENSNLSSQQGGWRKTTSELKQMVEITNFGSGGNMTPQKTKWSK